MPVGTAIGTRGDLEPKSPNRAVSIVANFATNWSAAWVAKLPSEPPSGCGRTEAKVAGSVVGGLDCCKFCKVGRRVERRNYPSRTPTSPQNRSRLLQNLQGLGVLLGGEPGMSDAELAGSADRPSRSLQNLQTLGRAQWPLCCKFCNSWASPRHRPPFLAEGQRAATMKIVFSVFRPPPRPSTGGGGFSCPPTRTPPGVWDDCLSRSKVLSVMGCCGSG